MMDAQVGTAEATAAVTARMRQWARRSAVDYLGKHSSGVENLRKVMLRRAGRKFPETGREGADALAAEAVSFCLEHAFVDDKSFAEGRVRAGVRKGHSRRRIALGLAAKGIDREHAGEALALSDDVAAAAAFARKRRIGPWRKVPLDAEARRREAGAFGRNGFGGDTANAVIAMTTEDAEAAIDAAERRF